jgi:hypothetical protein
MNPSSHVQKKTRPEKAIISLGDQKEKPLCVRYVELIRLSAMEVDPLTAHHDPDGSKNFDF